MAFSLDPTVGKKISLLTALVTLVATGAVAIFSAQLLDREIASQSRTSAEQTATLLSSRIDQELQSAEEKARLLISTALADFKSRTEQFRLLERSMATEEGILAVTLYTRADESSAPWSPTLRLTRPESNPPLISEADLRHLDSLYPVEASSLIAARLENGTPLLRYSFPLDPSSHATTRMIVLELQQEILASLFSKDAPHFSFLLDRRSRVILQTDSTHFTFGENVSTLPILRMAASSDSLTGRMDYSEVPGGSEYYGAFGKISHGNLLVITEAPRKTVFDAWQRYFGSTGFFIAGGLIAILFLIWPIAWFLFARPLERMVTVIEQVEGGQSTSPTAERFAPECHSEDEIGDLARAIQKLAAQIQPRKKTSRRKTKAALNSEAPAATPPETPIGPSSPAPIAEPIILEPAVEPVVAPAAEAPASAQESQALVLHCGLHGLEEAPGAVDAVNALKQELARVIENQLGELATNTGEGALIGFWRISDEKDLPQTIEHALEASLALSALFKEKKSGELETLTFTQGLHHGPIVMTEEEGSPRSLAGETVEISARIADFAASLGAETLMTRAVQAHAPQWFSTEKIAPADGDNPEIHELNGKADSIQETTDEPIEALPEDLLSADSEEPRIA